MGVEVSREGEEDYRAAVGPAEWYDLISALQFNVLTSIGLRETHSLLDIGCGSLRGGRLFIPYLRADRYFGIEPDERLVAEGIRNEVGNDLVRIKRPTFRYAGDFSLSAFARSFDFLLAQSIFSHTSRRQLTTCLGEAKKVMTPTSVFVATYFEGDEDYAGDTWKVGRAHFRRETLMTLAAENGLTAERLDWPHPNGQTWVAITEAGAARTFPRGQGSDVFMREQLEACERRLSQLERHPYVRAGMAVRAFLRRAASARRD